jgi:hypothetical protein
MEIEIEAVRRGGFEHLVERRIGLGRQRFAHIAEPAEHAAMPGDGLDDIAELGRVIDGAFDRIERGRLQGDTALPLLAHLGEHAPGDRGLLADRVDMGAQRAGAVREGAAQRKVHAPGDVLRRPVGLAVRHHGHAGAEE